MLFGQNEKWNWFVVLTPLSVYIGWNRTLKSLFSLTSRETPSPSPCLSLFDAASPCLLFISSVCSPVRRTTFALLRVVLPLWLSLCIPFTWCRCFYFLCRRSPLSSSCGWCCYCWYVAALLSSFLSLRYPCPVLSPLSWCYCLAVLSYSVVVFLVFMVLLLLLMCRRRFDVLLVVVVSKPIGRVF